MTETAHFPGGSEPPPPNTWFPDHTSVHISKGSSINSAVFIGLTVASNGHTHQQTDTHTNRYICNYMPHHHCLNVTRPNSGTVTLT